MQHNLKSKNTKNKIYSYSNVNTKNEVFFTNNAET